MPVCASKWYLCRAQKKKCHSRTLFDPPLIVVYADVLHAMQITESSRQDLFSTSLIRLVEN